MVLFSGEEASDMWLRQITMVQSGQVQLRLQASLEEPVFAGVQGDQNGQRPQIRWPPSSELRIIGAVREPTATFDQQAIGSRDKLTRQLAT